MAFSQVKHSETFKAASDFDPAQFHIVELTSNAHEAELALANEGYGVCQNHPRTGEAATVATLGVSKCIAGGAVVVLEWITAADSGFAAVSNSGDATSRKIMGQALTACASGGIFSLKIDKRTVSSGSAL